MTDIKELAEIIIAIDNINEDLYEQLSTHGKEMNPWVYCELQIGSGMNIVMFMGESVYTSNVEDRKWIEEQEFDDLTPIPSHYEPFEPYLRKKINNLITALTIIKL